jgi:transketolase
VLSRQELPVLSRPAGFDMTAILRGGYVLSESAAAGAGPAAAGAKEAAVVLIASGSEVSSAIEAQTLLAGRGVTSRVVSMPCPQIFRGQPDAYRHGVVPADGLKVVVEAAVLQGWEAIAGPEALFLGVDRFGASAPWKILQDKYGLSGARVADAVLRRLGRA